MIAVRTLFAIILAVALAALPARISAIGISGGTAVIAAGMADCELMSNSAIASDEMTGGIDQPGHHKNTQPGACFTYCNSVPFPATLVSTAPIIVISEYIAPAVGTTLVGIGLPPEPHPPKLA